MFPQLGMMEMVVVMGVAVLLFGKRLPEVGRSLGKGIIEFKKGLNGIEETFDLSSMTSPSTPKRVEEPAHSNNGGYADAAVPKFEPPTAPPVPSMEYTAPAESTPS